MKTITNGNYYRIKFDSLPYEVYEYGQTALEAIATARQEVDGRGSASARNAVYKEWNNGTEHYTNGGGFIRDTRKPCRECGTPVEFHTHKTELGFCVECSNKFWSGDLDD